MANKKNNFGVTPIIGTVLLLAMAIGLFSVLNVIVFSFPINPRTPSVSLTASIEYINDEDPGTIYLEHNGGEALIKDDIQIVVTILGSDDTHLTTEGIYSSDSDLFSIGNRWEFNSEVDLRNEEISVTVVHLPTNSILTMGTIQEGDKS